VDRREKHSLEAEGDSAAIEQVGGCLEVTTAWKHVERAGESMHLAPGRPDVQRQGQVGFSAAFGRSVPCALAGIENITVVFDRLRKKVIRHSPTSWIQHPGGSPMHYLRLF